MVDHASERPDSPSSASSSPESTDRTTKVGGDRTDKILRWVVVALVAAVIGFAAYFGYTVYQTRQAESTATPALRAIKGLEKLVRESPNSAAARVRLAEAYAAAGQAKPANDQLSQAVKLDPKHTGAWLDLGILAMQADERNQAERYFTKVVELTEGAQFAAINDRREQALFHLGEIALDDRRYADAAGYFKAALRIRKDASDTYFLLASALRGVDDNDAALQQLDAALAFDPNYPEAHNLYGEILLAKGDKVNAAIHFRKAADLAPEAKLPQENLAKLGKVSDILDQGRAAYKSGDMGAAIDAALLVRAIEPANTDATLLYVDALVERGEQAEAVKVLKDALTSQPEDAQLKDKLAKLGG